MLQNYLTNIKADTRFENLTNNSTSPPMPNPFAATPVIPNHFDLNFLLNPTNRPLFARAFSQPEHEYLEEQFYVFCEIQDSIARLDRLMKFTIENMKQRGISVLIFAIKDLQSANQCLQSTLRKRTARQGRPRPRPPVTTPLQNRIISPISNESSFHASITEEFSSILNNPKCAPPGPNTPSTIIHLLTPTPPSGHISSLGAEETPALLVDKVFPTHMRHARCFQCQRVGHYKSFCPYYQCHACKRYAPQHYPHECPFHPPLHDVRIHDDEDDEDDEDDDDVPDQFDDLDDVAWGNVTGEPVRDL
jgi:hypothetical protein